MQQVEFHILPQDNHWRISSDDTYIALYDTRDDALRQACDRAVAICGLQGKKRWKLVLHDSDGQVHRMTVPC